MPYNRHLIRDFEKSQRDQPTWPVVLSEGDSWFSYANAIGELDDPHDTAQPQHQRPWSLLRLEKNGDEVMTILAGGQRSLLRKAFARWPLDAVLFSGGGNDIIGPDLLSLLRPFVIGMTARDVVQFSRFERRLRQIQDCYRELLDLLIDAGQDTRVFVNSYDYVEPSDQGATLFGLVKVSGPWVKPHLVERGVPPNLWPGVIILLIDAFATAIDQVAAEPRGVDRLIRVETRGVVQGAWKDEIHPSPAGSRRVAAAFEQALVGAGVL